MLSILLPKKHIVITPVLVQLHWLPITKRRQFKILTMTYKALHHNAPTYICDMLNWCQPARTLQSASTTSLVPNRNRTIRYGRRLLHTFICLSFDIYYDVAFIVYSVRVHILCSLDHIQ